MCAEDDVFTLLAQLEQGPDGKGQFLNPPAVNFDPKLLSERHFVLGQLKFNNVSANFPILRFLIFYLHGDYSAQVAVGVRNGHRRHPNGKSAISGAVGHQLVLAAAVEAEVAVVERLELAAKHVATPFSWKNPHKNNNRKLILSTV